MRRKPPLPPPADEAVRALGSLSHELRGPLNGIVGGLELLRDTELSAEQRRYVELISSGSEALLELAARLPELATRAPVEPPQTPPTPGIVGNRVLVAEESRVNQMIAVEQLGRLGLEADAVGSVAEMVGKLAQGKYAAVMVDCRLPDADPCLTVLTLRRAEEKGRRVRIIGVAPEDRPGERERCLAAGMDGYIAKPLRLEDLRALFALGSSTAAATPTPQAPEPEAPAVDAGQIESLRAEAPGLLERLVELFAESATKTLQEMRDALARNDRRSLAAAAHMLKGSSSNFGAHRMMEACQALEDAISTRVNRLETHLDTLVAEYRLVDRALRACTPGSSA